MTAVGVPPLTEKQLGDRRRASIGVLPDDARHALRWLRRRWTTSPLLPLAVRRTLLRAGGVKLGMMVWGLDRCFFESPRVSIGTGSAVNGGCWFEGASEITIGENCLVGPEVLVLTSTHALSADGEISRTPASRPVTVGDGSWIGARATILPGVTIGAGAMIAAGAVVTADCEAGGVYGGVPARRIR